jgi:hypothetical protein
LRKYSPTEIEEQLKYLNNAHNLTAEERERVLSLLEEGTRDEGPFSWVKCPVWRLRLSEISKTAFLDSGKLSLILRYVLEGDRNAVELLVPTPKSVPTPG